MDTFFNKQAPDNMPPLAATIGMFDGVHRGHRLVVDHLRQAASARGLKTAVFTFPNHPQLLFHPDCGLRLLTSPEKKASLLAQTGVDYTFFLSFTHELAAMTAREFMTLLRSRYNVRLLAVGYDHRFGHNRAEGFADYVAYGREMGMEVVQNPVFELEGVNVSSTVCRRHVAAGEMEAASRCLGYPYRMGGRVVAGFQEGRKLGFPTANIQLADPRRLVPASGVYAVRVKVGDEATWRLGMMNIGTRPTFGGEKVSLEVHIFDFAGDLYGCQVEVAFLRRVREERKFASPEELAAQLARDKQTILDACCLS